jgi:hypothetical protein
VVAYPPSYYIYCHLLTFSIAIYIPIVVSSLDAIYPPITTYPSITVCPSVTISSPIVIISYSVVNKPQDKQILASNILAKFQWITFWLGTDRCIVIK